ncbi:hypothetical protein MAPG_09143 [Magnaporthiopsis poae ATCC 64411]|uniref:Cell wall protein PhiA n=1 Tax=Magnaporthiopsis poae (strain ATCC 64411 / 73-15) TaxID=644358 RepID=A0A0C4E964_MAGP6|nr:hypothetical protein MAPG_09143 [Magnaporthiopsis poae ATCC 64411]
MQFLALAASVLSLLAAPASAAPADPPVIAADARFNLISLRTGHKAHLQFVQAANHGLSLHLPAQNATCEGGAEDPEMATFFLRDGGLFLESPRATPQQVFVMRSAMGQGQVAYSTGNQTAWRNSERTTFRLDNINNLMFNDVTFLACPPRGGQANEPAGSFSIWVRAGVDEPQGHRNCVSVSLRASQAKKPVTCLYAA